MREIRERGRKRERGEGGLSRTVTNRCVGKGDKTDLLFTPCNNTGTEEEHGTAQAGRSRPGRVGYGRAISENGRPAADDGDRPQEEELTARECPSVFMFFNPKCGVVDYA